MQKFTIREMTGADWAAVSEIYLQGIASNLATFESVCPPYEQWDAAHLKACRLVLCDGDAVAGWAALSPVSTRRVFSGVAEISIYLHNDYQGKGAGTKLMLAAMDASECAGIWCLYSAIFSNNIASLRLHEKCGFRLVGIREKLGRDIKGQWRDVTIMERRSKLPQFN